MDLKKYRDIRFFKNSRYIQALFLCWWASSVLFVFVVSVGLDISGADFFKRYVFWYFPIEEKIIYTARFPGEALWFHFYFFVSAFFFAIPISKAVSEGIFLDRTVAMLIFGSIFLCFVLSFFGIDFGREGRGIGRLLPIVFNYNWMSSSLIFLFSFGGLVAFSSIFLKSFGRKA